MAKIAFRVDSSVQIGSGHVIRCRTLAESLRHQGNDVVFICREHEGHLCELLSQSKFAVIMLPSPQIDESLEKHNGYVSWLGVSQEQDARETIHALVEEKIDWLIVDHYGLDQVWETRLRSHTRKIFVIDDLANRCHNCDILLDQNESLEGKNRYQNLVPEDCELLVGCRYALLRSEYRKYRKQLNRTTEEVKRVFIFFGGTDADNMTGTAISALSSLELKHLNLDVVIGATNPHQKDIEIQAVQRGNITLYCLRPHLADLMAKADMAIGGGGTTTWERFCLGLPSLVIGLAENQFASAEFLHESGFLYYLGTSRNCTVDDIQKSVQFFLSKKTEIYKMSMRSMNLVDGKGTLRIGAILNSI